MTPAATPSGGGPVADQDRTILDPAGAEAVAAPDQGRVERDHVEQRAEAQLLLQQPRERPALGPEAMRVEEQLAGVVTGLAVDVHGPGEVGGQAIVQPVGIGEPGIVVGQRDELARREGDPGPSSPRPSPSSTRATPGVDGDQLAGPGAIGLTAGVDVGQLMVADGEGPAAEGVEDLAERARPDREQAGLAEDAIDQHRPADVDSGRTR